MNPRELSPQQADPLGALSQRPITVVLTIFALTLAIGRTVIETDPGSDLVLAWIAVGLVAVAAVVVVVASSAYRAPFGRLSFGIVVGLGIVAIVVEALSTSHRDLMIRDDWGAPALGMLILASAPYRPGRELLAAAVVGALVIVPITIAQAPGFVVHAPTSFFVIVAIVPIVTLGIGGAVYSATFVRLVLSWMDRATSFNHAHAQDLRPSITRSVQQDRVTGLNQDVVPFFAGLVGSGTVTENDRARAISVAESLRQRIIADSDRSWLEQLLVDLASRRTTTTITDEAQLAARMSADQRTAMRALIGAVVGDSEPVVSNLTVVLNDDAPLVRAVIRIESAAEVVGMRQRFAPYLAVFRILFSDLLVDVAGSSLTLRFSYEQH